MLVSAVASRKYVRWCFTSVTDADDLAQQFEGVVVSGPRARGFGSDYVPASVPSVMFLLYGCAHWSWGGCSDARTCDFMEFYLLLGMVVGLILGIATIVFATR